MPQGPAPAGILADGGVGGGGPTRGVAFGRGWDSQGGRTDRKRLRFDNQPRFDNTPWRPGGWRPRGGRGRGNSGGGRGDQDARRFERWGWRNIAQEELQLPLMGMVTMLGRKYTTCDGYSRPTIQHLQI